jgi:HprK-related kinase A
MSTPLPLRIADWSGQQLASNLAAGAVVVDYGAACARIRVPDALPSFLHAFATVYQNFPAWRREERPFADFHIEMQASKGVRRWWRPQVHFAIDGIRPFEPFSDANALPHYEWGLNWSFGQRCNQYVLLHAGAVSEASRAVIMAAPPGSGKSTLTAALMLSGMRLLSDEFGVVCPQSGLLKAMLKPVALKNEAIDVIRSLSPLAQLGPRFYGTRKGDVAHLAPSESSLGDLHQAVRPALLVFPQFRAGAPLSLQEVPAYEAFGKLAFNSFNYHLLGPVAFDVVATLAERCPAYAIEYGDIEAAVACIRALLAEAVAREGRA